MNGSGIKLPFLKCSLTIYRYELLFYPRYHLDQSSLLHRKTLLAKPMVMDVYQDYLLVTYRPFDVHIFLVKLSSDLTPSNTPELQVVPHRTVTKLETVDGVDNAL